MPRINKRTIDNIVIPREGQFLLWDDKLSGFGVRILPSGTITFIVRYRTRSGRQRKMSLGRYGIVSATWLESELFRS